MALTGLPARTGFKEVVVIGETVTYPIVSPIAAPSYPVRCTDVSITPSQAVELPELIQGGVDRSAYQINQQQVEGDISFPICALVGASQSVETPPGYEMTTVDPGVDTVFTNGLLNANDIDTLYSTFEIGTTYHGVFKNCMVNSIAITGAEGGPVSATANIWPTHIDDDTEGDDPTTYYDLSEVEIIMFYNVLINSGDDITLGDWALSPALIRSFVTKLRPSPGSAE